MTAASVSARTARAPTAARVLERLAPGLPLFTTLALASLFVLFAMPGFIVQDTWLALVAGRETAAHGLPTHDHLTLLAAGHRWIDQQWLGQLFLYGLSLVGGVKAVVLTCEAAALSAWALTIAAAGRRGAPAPAAVTVLVAAGVISSPWALQARTQELALPLFAAILWLLLADPLMVKRRTLWVLGMLVVWANVHGSAILGVAIVLAFALAAGRAAPRRRLWPYLAAPLTLFVSPYGGGLAGYYRLMVVSAPFRRYIYEWQPSRPSVVTAVFYLLVACAMAVVARRRRDYNAGELVILGLTCIAAAWAIRNIVWFALAAAAILPVRERGEAFRTPGAGLAAVAMACVIPVTAVLALTRPASYWQGQVSAAATQALRPLVARPGAILADDAHADWLLWHFPQVRGRLVYDDRVELLTSRQLRLIQGVLYGGRGTLGACLVVIHPSEAARFPGRMVWRDSTTAVLGENITGCRSVDAWH